MADENTIPAEVELHRLDGALDVLFTLREEFAQWLEEAQDASKREALENALTHVELMENEYKRRRGEARARPSGG